MAVVAPLIIGGVHRWVLLMMMAAALVAVILFAVGAWVEGRPVRVGIEVLLPCAFLLIPALQAVPLGRSVRAAIDPRGSALLADSLDGSARSAPLSLDPPSTRADLGRAAVALVIFLLAFHAAAGQSRRHVFLRAVAGVGVAAVLIGVGHRVFGVAKIYGLVNSTARTLVIGPFVNSNHTAELLELAAFACFACAFLRPGALGRVGWIAGAILCIGGVAATLSRGGVLGTAVGGATFLVIQTLTRRDRDAPAGRRFSIGWVALLLVFVLVGAAAMGAGQLVDRFHTGSVTNDVRFQLWRNSLRVLAAHPFGVGRGAFERVFPVYRELNTSFPLQFSFVENEPLQLLLDCGWFFFALLTAAVGVAIWALVRRGRRDRTEALLIAGLVAIGVHSFFDFGLETLGVVVPFMAILGTLLGRAHAGSGREHPRIAALAVGAAILGLIVGWGSVASASSDDFDGLLKKVRDVQARRQLLERAQRAHPVDYFYVLAYARLQPLKAGGSTASPRLHALNRALALCPRCETVHAEVARNLWSIGLKRQSLLEWRTAVQLQPLILPEAFQSLLSGGATPPELAAIAGSDARRMIKVAELMRAAGSPASAMAVLDQAAAVSTPTAELLIERAQLQLQLGQTDAVTATLAQAKAQGLSDPRLSALEARQLLNTRGAAAADEALAILDSAAVRYPTDLSVQRARVDLVRDYGRWRAVDRALEGLKQAVYREQGRGTEAHVAAGRLYARLSRYVNAINEYQMALLESPDDVSLWMEFAGVAIAAGRPLVARDAYNQAARISPNDPTIRRMLQTLDERMAHAREPASDGPAQPDWAR